MPKVESGTPKMLRPYEFHGVHLEWEEGKDEATGDCPWCGREGKFSVLIETGQWRCFVCNEGADSDKVYKGGNAFTFIRMLWEQSLESTTDYSNLKVHRKLLTDESLRNWGVCKAVLGYSNWLIPGFNAEGKLTQLYRYIKDKVSGKFRLIPTPELGHGLHGMNLFDPDKKEVYLNEGPWDGTAWWEALAGTKRIDGGKLTITASIENSLLQDANVLATPGCNVFNEGWINLFARKHVYLMYDNDHSKLNRGKLVESAGYAGMRRVAQLLARADEPPETIRFLKWGDNGFDRALPSGYDVRDCLSQGATQSQRVTFVQHLINKIQPIPEDWIEGRSKSTAKKGGTEMELVSCTTWADLVVEWRKALKWTEGLDRALSIMLACVTSTKALGDQLWVKIIGPPACLDGDTKIYDPIEGSTKTVRERCKLGARFAVYTKREDGSVGIAQALPPVRYAPQSMYKVTFESNRQITVTGGHQFLTTDGFVELQEILRSNLRHRLPTIQEQYLRAHKTYDHYDWQTVLDSQSSCENGADLCDEPLQMGEDTHQRVSPLPIGARKYFHSLLDVGALLGSAPVHTHLNHRPSTLGFLSLVSLLQCEGESECLQGEGIGESRGLPSPFFLQSHQLNNHSRTEQSSHEYGPSSTVYHKPRPVRPGFGQSCPDQFVASRLFCAECSQTHKALHKSRFSLDSNLVGRPDESLHPSSVGTSSLQPGRFASVCNIQPECGQIGTNQLTSSVEQESNQPEQPCLFSINKFRLRIDQSILTEVDTIVKVEYVGEREYFDFHVPETNNYWCEGLFHHNCGKSTLCEALSTNRDFTVAKSTIRGFHSGYKTDKEGEEDHSLIPLVMGKTLITKDGDTLLQSPNLGQILSEARDLYDSVSRTSYRHGMNRDYEGVRMTWILCGTSSLRSIDSSELGERFLDCVIMDRIEEDLEDEILIRKANQAKRCLSYEADGKAETQNDPDLVRAMQLTGGYIEHLRKNARNLMDAVEMTDEAMTTCIHYAKFVAHLRARPSKKQDESAEREFATRLTSQIVRLANCVAVVLNRKTVDHEVLRRVKRVTMDTARGRTMEICRHLFRAGDIGLDTKALAMYTNQTEDSERTLLRFLRKIEVVDSFVIKAPGVSQRPRWKLTARMKRLYTEVCVEEPSNGHVRS